MLLFLPVGGSIILNTMTTWWMSSGQIFWRESNSWPNVSQQKFVFCKIFAQSLIFLLSAILVKSLFRRMHSYFKSFFFFDEYFDLMIWPKKLSETGVLNSNSFEHHILTKNELAGRIKIKIGPRGSQ